MERTLGPTRTNERIAVIDILRGFAIFGILVVNTYYFLNPSLVSSEVAGPSIADSAINFVIDFLFASKFYTLFSFLFGLGMYIQMKRSQEKGVRFVPLYLKRLLILAMFGFAHGVLLWTGDILLTYAITGVMLLLFFRNCKPRTLLIWAIVLIVLPQVFTTVSDANLKDAYVGPSEMDIYDKPKPDFANTNTVNDYDVYADGGFVDVTISRFNDVTSSLLNFDWFMISSVLAMFLLGVRAGKRGWFTNPQEHHATFRNLLLWTLPVGLITNLYSTMGYYGNEQFGSGVAAFMTLLQNVALDVGSVLLCLSYIALIVQLCKTTAGAHVLRPLTSVGRMALSNYLMQSIVMTTLSYGYGFRLLGTVSIAVGFLMSIVLYAIQILLSNWWMRRFRFGPFEWVWRSLTYGTFQKYARHETTPSNEVMHT